jgi:hypothetical protein
VDAGKVKISGSISGPSTGVKVGLLARSGREYVIDLDGCCERKQNGGRSCIPASDCPTQDFQLQWDPAEGTLGLETRDGSGRYPFFGQDSEDLRHPVAFKVWLSGGARVTGLKIISADLEWVQSHLKKGAAMAVEGQDPECGPGSARCGDTCGGVCPDFCMCYPNGYTGVRRLPLAPRALPLTRLIGISRIAQTLRRNWVDTCRRLTPFGRWG